MVKDKVVCMKLRLVVHSGEYCRKDASNLQSHSKRPLLRIRARQRQPRNIQRMRERPKDLRPHDAEVADAAGWNLGEDAVENVAEQVHA